jgi:orotate phosphoribosyltransferase
LLFDDLITQADSKIEAIDVLEAWQIVISGIVVLVDRMQGGREQLEAAGYRLYSVFTLSQLLEHYVSRGFLAQAKADEVLAYVTSNRANGSSRP